MSDRPGVVDFRLWPESSGGGLIFFLLAAAVASPSLGPTAEKAPEAYSAMIRTSAPLSGEQGEIADLIVDKNEAAVCVRRREQKPFCILLSTVDRVLMLLADRRVEPLWPAMLNWAGSNLEALRDRRLAVAYRNAYDSKIPSATSTAASLVRPRTQASLQLAGELWVAGRRESAMSTIESARGSEPAKDRLGQIEWTVLSLRLADNRFQLYGADNALAFLDRSEAALPPNTEHAVNFSINRAAILAESGQYGGALAAVDKASDQASALPRRLRKSVPGSDREFAWIRACALNGLGRKAEAAALVTQLKSATNPSNSRIVTTPTNEIRFRLANCMRDVSLAVAELQDDLDRYPVGGFSFLYLQPALAPSPRMNPQFLSRVAEDSASTARLRERLRPLPPELVPALNSWRGADLERSEAMRTLVRDIDARRTTAGN